MGGGWRLGQLLVLMTAQGAWCGRGGAYPWALDPGNEGQASRVGWREAELGWTDAGKGWGGEEEATLVRHGGRGNSTTGRTEGGGVGGSDGDGGGGA